MKTIPWDNEGEHFFPIIFTLVAGWTTWPTIVSRECMTKCKMTRTFKKNPSVSVAEATSISSFRECFWAGLAVRCFFLFFLFFEVFGRLRETSTSLTLNLEISRICSSIFFKTNRKLRERKKRAWVCFDLGEDFLKLWYHWRFLESWHDVIDGHSITRILGPVCFEISLSQKQGWVRRQ